MMNSREILILKQKALSTLSNNELKDAFEILAKLIVTAQNWSLSEKLSEQESNYKYMLHYFFEGVEDPKRNEVYSKLIRSLYELTDDICDELLVSQSTNYFYERLRINSLKSIEFDSYQHQLKEITTDLSLVDLIEEETERTSRKKLLAVKRERLGTDLFNYIFSSSRATEQLVDQFTSFLQDEEVPIREKCLFISALTLNIFYRFDPLKIKVLLYAATSELKQVRARAMVGLVIIIQMYDKRWNLYPELNKILESFSENIDFKKSILRIIIQLIRSRDTEKISKKMKEEIIPQMMKFSSKTGKRLSMEDLMGETDFMDKNPEWQKELEESGLNKKLQEYSELQMEGADVFHSTFANLKNFPFFTEMSNWFMPFDPNYSEISDLFPDSQKDSLLRMAVVDSGHMCNSDKYSFCLSLTQIPTSQREMMMTRMGAESDEIKRMQKEAQSMNPRIDDEVLSNQYIQDLYRFYKLNSRRNDFLDIFKLSLDFYSKQALLPLISDQNSMTQIANYCFDKNHFDVALDIYNHIIEKGSESDSVWQKIGFCLQAQNRDKEALEAYLRADLINPNKSWTLRKIGQLYRTLGQPEQALSYYQKASQITPDNINIELNIGHCYLEMKDYNNALNTYFKVEIIAGNSNKAYRPIAWTAYLLEKYDTAEKYYDRILKSNPTLHDYLNAGHVQLTIGKLKLALKYYKNAALMADDMKHFMTLIAADENVLIKHGVKKEIFPYLFDQIKYTLD